MYGDVSLLTPLMAGGGKGTPWHPGGDVSTDTASPVGEHPCCCGASGWVCSLPSACQVIARLTSWERLSQMRASLNTCCGWVCKYLGGVVVSGGVCIYEALYSINNSLEGMNTMKTAKTTIAKATTCYHIRNLRLRARIRSVVTVLNQ